jgi:hypothetical protein
MYYFRIVYQRYIIICDICQYIVWTYITEEIYRKHINMKNTSFKNIKLSLNYFLWIHEITFVSIWRRLFQKSFTHTKVRYLYCCPKKRWNKKRIFVFCIIQLFQVSYRLFFFHIYTRFPTTNHVRRYWSFKRKWSVLMSCGIGFGGCQLTLWVLTKFSTIVQFYHIGQRETTDSGEIHLQTKMVIDRHE